MYKIAQRVYVNCINSNFVSYTSDMAVTARKVRNKGIILLKNCTYTHTHTHMHIIV